MPEEDPRFVDSSDWHSLWSCQWAVFADLLGFEAASKSAAVATNQIVRFHRLLERTSDAAPGRPYRFTDAAYYTAPGFVEAVAWAVRLQHEALAMNIDAASRRKVEHHLLKCRVTIAHGRVLNASGRDLPAGQAFGVDSESLLAGQGIVDAYRLEKQATAFEIGVAVPPTFSWTDLNFGGEPRLGARLKNALAEGTNTFRHDDMVSFPWYLFRKELGRSNNLVLDDNGASVERVRELRQHQNIMRQSFCRTDMVAGVGKHVACVDRMVSRAENYLGL